MKHCARRGDAGIPLRFAIVLASLAVLTLPLAASAPPSQAEASPAVARDLVTGNGGATIHQHYDCVGPGLPLTAPQHATHTQNVGGLAFNGRLVRFNVVAFTPLGNGICPTTQSGPVLPQDFTGTWHLTAVCSTGTTNPGTVWLDWEVQFVAGQAVGSGSNGLPCSGYANTAFSVDVTLEMSSVNVLGVDVPPTGGVLLTITQ